MTESAQAAQAIRKELKAKFPNTKFSVRSSNFAGGDAVRIDWTDGPTTKRVDDIVDKYQYGHFDGMIDLYEYSNKRVDIPQAKYVQTQREMSDKTLQRLVNKINKDYGWELKVVANDYGTHIDRDSIQPKEMGGYQDQDVHRMFQEMSL